MSAALLFRVSTRKTIFAACLLAFPMMAQQVGTPDQSVSTTLASGTTAQAGGTQAPASAPDAPAPKKIGVTGTDYSKPAGYFPNPFGPYTPRSVPPASFVNAPRIDQLIVNGKLMLSLNDAISLALADNLDIAFARYNLPLADTDILLTKAGGSPRGLNTGLVQNTPGGTGSGVGGSAGPGAGGSTTGASGAGAGGGGQVISASGAGPQPDSFDPVLSGTLQMEHNVTPVNFGLVSGLGAGQATSRSHSAVANFTYFQGFSPGTTLTFVFDNNRQSSNSTGILFNPNVNSNFRATIRQHLLQGFGPSLNTRFIRQAKNTRKITEESFRNQVIVTVSQIEDLYWDLVNFYEDVGVKQRSLALAEKTLSDNRKQVEIGTLAPIDIVRAQNSVSQAQQDLIVSQTNLQLQQLQMKNAITRNFSGDPALSQAEVIPTDRVQLPEQENLPAVEDLIKQAIASRPDYIELKINLETSQFLLKGANNGLLPTLDFSAFYGATGLAGDPNVLVPANAGLPTSGLGTSLSNLFNSSGPDKGVTLTLSIPIRNRAAQATQIRSRLEFRQAEVRVKQLENQIALQIRNDTFALQQARARVAAAQQARELAVQTLDAEQKKYALGASTYILVLGFQRDMAQSESLLVTAMTNYAKARVLLDQDTAQTLDRNNIQVEEAFSGDVKTMPNVPGTKPIQTTTQTPSPK